jgi:replicative DNA helicase
VRTRISGSLFTDPARLATFAAICDLAERGDPIDPVTVCWSAQREQTLRGKGLDADTVVRLAANPPAGDGAHAASVMASFAARAVADRSAAQLAEVANHPGIDLADMLDTARAHAAAVRRAVAGPTGPRPGNWSRPPHLQLVGATPAAKTDGRAM